MPKLPASDGAATAEHVQRQRSQNQGKHAAQEAHDRLRQGGLQGGAGARGVDQQVVAHRIRAEHQAAADVVQRQAVPHAHGQQRREDADVLRRHAMAAEELGLAQRLVDRHEHDVAQPLRQADVPAAPEVLRIERGQRIAEVDRQREAEQHADADRHPRRP
ncbi:hypothetical protein G6F68_016161 [Rhizopus microsporus]|nr:hypothetical protein G6F68_016161 [Rhizopus microsporus]